MQLSLVAWQYINNFIPLFLEFFFAGKGFTNNRIKIIFKKFPVLSGQAWDGQPFYVFMCSRPSYPRGKFTLGFFVKVPKKLAGKNPMLTWQTRRKSTETILTTWIWTNSNICPTSEWTVLTRTVLYNGQEWPLVGNFSIFFWPL